MPSARRAAARWSCVGVDIRYWFPAMLAMSSCGAFVKNGWEPPPGLLGPDHVRSQSSSLLAALRSAVFVASKAASALTTRSNWWATSWRVTVICWSPRWLNGAGKASSVRSPTWNEKLSRAGGGAQGGEGSGRRHGRRAARRTC